MSSRFCRRGRAPTQADGVSGRAIFLPYQRRCPATDSSTGCLIRSPRSRAMSVAVARRRFGGTDIAAAGRRRSSPVTAWHRRLALHGLIPVMQILEGPVSYARAAIREEAWRRRTWWPGSELLNAVPCVDGRHEGDTIWTAETAGEEVRALASRLDSAAPSDPPAVRRQRSERPRHGDRAPARRAPRDRRGAGACHAHARVDARGCRTHRSQSRGEAWPRALSDAKGVRRRRSERPVPRDHHSLRGTQGVRMATRPPQRAKRVDEREGRRGRRQSRRQTRRHSVDIPPTARCAGTDRRG